MDFPPDAINEDLLLNCPGCNEDYLRHKKIEVFERDEDADKGIHYSIEKDSSKIDSDISNNPSPRRNGLRILFSCENCDCTPALYMYQHKGNSFLKFNIS